MTPALFALLFCSLVLLLGNTIVGHAPGVAGAWFGMEFLEFHIILGVLASLLALFTVCMIMFYLIGTGKQIKENIREHDLDASLYGPVTDGKRKFFPTLTLAMVLYVALPGVGAALTVEAVGSGFHTMISYLTLVTHLFVCYQSWHHLRAQDRVIVTVDRQVRTIESE